ncbi:MAG: 30S ribosomal protein S6 [Planctomycetes bacterium]|nr:30S ribosomal protein S6 [Planctomycetota bacterium]
MKNYEGMFLIDSREYKKNPNEVEDQIKSLIEKCKGEIVRFEKWDERKLAYEIKGATSGVYYLYYFKGDADTIRLLNREVAISPLVLRLLSIRLNTIPEQTVRERPVDPEHEDHDYDNVVADDEGTEDDIAEVGYDDSDDEPVEESTKAARTHEDDEKTE